MTNLPTPTDVQTALAPYHIPSTVQVPAIVDNEQYVQSADFLKTVIAKKKEVDELRKSILRPLDAAKKNLNALFDPVLSTYDAWERQLRQSLKYYNNLLEAQRRDEEARLRDERLQEQRENEAAAQALEAEGKAVQAEYIRAKPLPPTPVVISDKPQARGVFTRKVYKAEVTNMIDFLTYVVENDAWHLITVNQTALDALARSSRSKTTVPGVSFTEYDTIVARA